MGVKQLRPAPPRGVTTGQIADVLEIDRDDLPRLLAQIHDVPDLMPKRQGSGRHLIWDHRQIMLVACLLSAHLPHPVLVKQRREELLRALWDAPWGTEEIILHPHTNLMIYYRPDWSLPDRILGAAKGTPV